ncbi:hypothetical protein B0H13DRAFT_2291934 [Mycena leptocephala]|nr:hypothetical protein B0H13DRAFT_2291934 [Mycena leptocephala]
MQLKLLTVLAAACLTGVSAQSGCMLDPPQGCPTGYIPCPSSVIHVVFCCPSWRLRDGAGRSPYMGTYFRPEVEYGSRLEATGGELREFVELAADKMITVVVDVKPELDQWQVLDFIDLFQSVSGIAKRTAGSSSPLDLNGTRLKPKISMLAHLEADRTRVTDLEAQILHLERSLSALRNEKTLVQERLDSYKYSVLTLPNEIVSEIFMHFLPAYPRFPPLTGILSPTILTQICRKWREIALGTPALWRIMSDSADPPFNLLAHVFNIWLNRSRSCPLSLQLGLAAPRSPIVGTTAVVLDAPLLRTVALDANAASKVILPWTQLTSLALLYVSPHECVPILQQTSNLVRCKLHFFFDPNSNHIGPDVTLPCLESLTLSHVDHESVTDFLETLIVPALRSLEIPEQLLDADPIKSLAVFISKSSCKLEELLIAGTVSVPLSSYCNAFPSIRNISFKERSFG